MLSKSEVTVILKQNYFTTHAINHIGIQRFQRLCRSCDEFYYRVDIAVPLEFSMGIQIPTSKMSI